MTYSQLMDALERVNSEMDARHAEYEAARLRYRQVESMVATIAKQNMLVHTRTPVPHWVKTLLSLNEHKHLEAATLDTCGCIVVPS